MSELVLSGDGRPARAGSFFPEGEGAFDEGLVVHPFAVVHELSEGVTTPEAWRTLVIGTGIGDLDLGGCAAPATR